MHTNATHFWEVRQQSGVGSLWTGALAIARFTAEVARTLMRLMTAAFSCASTRSTLFSSTMSAKASCSTACSTMYAVQHKSESTAPPGLQTP